MKEEYYNLSDESKKGRNRTGTGGRGGDSTNGSLF